jgi:Rad3-related DNA helicase
MCTYYKPSEECAYYTHCLYKVEKEYALKSDRKILNYKYFLTESNYVGRIGTLDFVICDEADKLEDEILGFVSMVVSDVRLRKYGLSFPKYKNPTEKNGLAEWQSWAKNVISHVVREKDNMEAEWERLCDCGEVSDALIKDIEKARSLITSLAMFINNVNESWISDVREMGSSTVWKFSPTWISKDIMGSYFKRFANKIVLMSATLSPKHILAVELGLDPSDIDEFIVPNHFDVTRRPIHLENIAPMTNTTWEDNIGKIRGRIKELAEVHANEKGLIHTSNYRIAQEIVKISDRFITHNTANRNDVLKQFTDSAEPLILVSPSMERGVDLHYDLCRWIVIAKVPYPNLGDKQVNKRLYSSGAIGKYWYTSATIKSIEQACGRGMRRADDECVIYILDSKASELLYNNVKMFSDYFKKCVVV